MTGEIVSAWWPSRNDRAEVKEAGEEGLFGLSSLSGRGKESGPSMKEGLFR